VPDDEHRPHALVELPHHLEEIVDPGDVDRLVDPDLDAVDPERTPAELPGLPGAQGAGAQDEVGSEPGRRQREADLTGLTAAHECERPLSVRMAGTTELFGLGVAEQDEPTDVRGGWHAS
jgi:hypothetical protein